MHVDGRTGLLNEALFLPSSHCEPRINEDDVDCIIIHNISLPPGEFGGVAIDALFLGSLNPEGHPCYQALHETKVSSHLLIRRDGSLTQYVPLHQQAWHAGESEWAGRPQCNLYSIGIELEGTDHISFTEQQYQQLVPVIKAIMIHYNRITLDRIVGHSDVAPGRKTDPGPHFDWGRLRTALLEE